VEDGVPEVQTARSTVKAAGSAHTMSGGLDLRKPWAASSRPDRRLADPRSLTHHLHGASSVTIPEDMRRTASLWAAQTCRQRPLVGPVGLEPTTYGLKERPKPVGKACDRPFRAWLVDAGWPCWTVFLALVCHKCATGASDWLL